MNKKIKILLLIGSVVVILIILSNNIGDKSVSKDNNYKKLRHETNTNGYLLPQNLLIKNNKEENEFKQNISLYYWKPSRTLDNFGDRLSYELVSRIVGRKINFTNHKGYKKKLLAIGSVLNAANNGDVVWGSGFLLHGRMNKEINNLDIRSVRGPRTRESLKKNFNLDAPEIYGDPALLFPYFFPEFKRNKYPKYDYVLIPHMSQTDAVFDKNDERVVRPTEDWQIVASKIINAKMVISTSLHGLIIAESFGIPARLLNENKYFQRRKAHIFKYEDYYFGTNRSEFKYANSVKEALEMGGEPPMRCDLDKLYSAFPKEFFSNHLVHKKLPKLN
jgi:pyruvyltransferase